MNYGNKLLSGGIYRLDILYWGLSYSQQKHYHLFNQTPISSIIFRIIFPLC